jgi:hypothetical protein
MKDSILSTTEGAEVDLLNAKSIEELREILEAEHGKSFSFDEASEIGRSLISLFETLAAETPQAESNGT